MVPLEDGMATSVTLKIAPGGTQALPLKNSMIPVVEFALVSPKDGVVDLCAVVPTGILTFSTPGIIKFSAKETLMTPDAFETTNWFAVPDPLVNSNSPLTSGIELKEILPRCFDITSPFVSSP